MPLKKDMDLISVTNTAFAPLQVVHPVATTVLDVWWKVLVYNLSVDLSSQYSRLFEAAQVFFQTTRSTQKFETLASYPSVRFPLIHPEWTLATFRKIKEEVAKRKMQKSHGSIFVG